MKLQNLIIIFIAIILPVILIISLYISTGLRTLEYQSMYDTGLIKATYDAIYAFEINTNNNIYSDNAETKRNILKASIKMFEKSLCNTCNISAYNTDEIEKYIPAIVFGMYDGFYMYAPSGVYDNTIGDAKEYKHNLRNYVYYSETLKGIGYNNSDVVIRYSLDNYVVVSGDFYDDEDGDGNKDGYKIKEGYLITGWDEAENKYKEVTITEETIDGNINQDAINYYKDAYEFTKWFNSNIGDEVNYLKIDEKNDPENPNSPFAQHKRTVIKNKIEGVLNSSITAYSKKTLGYTYKMPKLTEADWQKIYSNISMITFFQGKNIGLIKYNGYCVLNSTNNKEYVNPNLMYFIEGEDNKNHYYHDIRCGEIKDSIEKLTGYKIGAFRERKVEQTDENGATKYDENGNTLYKYIYDHNALACYKCVNGPLNTNKSIYEYIWGLGNTDEEKNIKSAYWTSLGRERYNQVHL